MSADKVYRAIGDALNATRPELGESERRRVIIALCDAVRDDEREKCEAEMAELREELWRAERSNAP